MNSIQFPYVDGPLPPEQLQRLCQFFEILHSIHLENEKKNKEQKQNAAFSHPR